MGARNHQGTPDMDQQAAVNLDEAALTPDGLHIVYPAHKALEAQETLMADDYTPEREQLTSESIGVHTALESIPRPVRLALYVVYAIGGPVLIYLSAKGAIGPDELGLWAGIGTVFGITAAGNTNSR